jgi:peptidoglycan hydrolase CwlO-like protein
LLGQKDSLVKEAQTEARNQRDQCRETLDRLMKEVNGELDETEARMLQMKEESKKLPHDITAMIAAVLRK